MIARLNAYGPLNFPVPTPAYNLAGMGDATSDAQAQTAASGVPSSWLIAAALVTGVSLYLVLGGRRQ